MKFGNAVLLIVVILTITAGVAYFLLTNNPEYKRITVVTGQGGEVVEFGDNIYAFGYTPKSAYQDATVNLMTGGLASKVYPAIEGVTYTGFGVEFVILEVHSDYVVLNVKSTIP